MAESLDRTKELDPPSEVEGAHNDLVEAGEDLLIAFEEAAEILSEAETMADFETLNTEADAGLGGAIQEFEAACLAVVDIAEANDIPVITTCEERTGILRHSVRCGQPHR